MPAKIDTKKSKDVARTTILILLVLTILISVVSTWYVMDMITSVREEYAAMPAITQAKISVGIINPNAEEPTITNPTAKAIINVGIIKP